TCDLTARVTTGVRFPDEPEGTPMRELADVLMLFCEDDAEDTVKPRLVAAGADCKRVHTMTIRELANGEERQLQINNDMDLLRKFLADNPNVRLIIIDPITSYVGPNVKPNDEVEFRRVLDPLTVL